jgi:hypothetical protein
MRIIIMDNHRVFAEAVVLEDSKFSSLGRIGMTRDHLEGFARTLLPRSYRGGSDRQRDSRHGYGRSLLAPALPQRSGGSGDAAQQSPLATSES